MKQYIVDACTDKPFSGNPAAVCVMESWSSEESMMKLAMENNLSETAFIVKEEAGYHLRWFTPGTEVELCGHATLASSFVILNYYQPDSDTVQFNTLSGVLTVRKKGSLYEMDFPTYELKEIPVTDRMEKAFGVRPLKAVLGLDLVCVSKAAFRMRRRQEQKLTAFQGASAPSLPLRRIRYAAPPTARLRITGQKNSGKSRSLPIRPQNEAAICTARCAETAESLSAERRHWSQSLRSPPNCLKDSPE